MTEFIDLCPLAIAKIGQLHCQQCGRSVQRSHGSSIGTSLLNTLPGNDHA